MVEFPNYLEFCKNQRSTCGSIVFSNEIDKTYLVIPSSYSNSLQLELIYSQCAKLSYLSLNLKVFFGLTLHNNFTKMTLPCFHPSLQRTSSLTILGVSFT